MVLLVRVDDDGSNSDARTSYTDDDFSYRVGVLTQECLRVLLRSEQRRPFERTELARWCILLFHILHLGPSELFLVGED